MRVLFLTHGVINYESDRNWGDTLRKYGDVEVFDYVSCLKRSDNHIRLNSEIRQFVSSRRFDFCFFPVYQTLVDVETILYIRKMGCKIVIWHSDDNTRFEKQSLVYAPYVDLNCTTYRSAYDKYVLRGYPVVLSRWAANPDYYVKMDVPKDIDVCFIGGKYGIRPKVVDQIKGFMKGNNLGKLYVCGKGWNRGRAPFKEYIRLINRSKIFLDISNDSRRITENQIKGRVPEVTMCGTFLLTGHHVELREMYELGEEIATYRKVEDALNCISFMLRNEDRREEIAKAGYERAHEDHTYDMRFRKIFKRLGCLS